LLNKNLNAIPENSIEVSPDVWVIHGLQISTPVGDNDSLAEPSGEEIFETKEPKPECREPQLECKGKEKDK
jgi:hypothetical protein